MSLILSPPPTVCILQIFSSVSRIVSWMCLICAISAYLGCFAAALFLYYPVLSPDVYLYMTSPSAEPGSVTPVGFGLAAGCPVASASQGQWNRLTPTRPECDNLSNSHGGERIHCLAATTPIRWFLQLPPWCNTCCVFRLFWHTFLIKSCSDKPKSTCENYSWCFIFLFFRCFVKKMRTGETSDIVSHRWDDWRCENCVVWRRVCTRIISLYTYVLLSVKYFIMLFSQT